MIIERLKSILIADALEQKICANPSELNMKELWYYEFDLYGIIQWGINVFSNKIDDVDERFYVVTYNMADDRFTTYAAWNMSEVVENNKCISMKLINNAIQNENC